MPVTVISMIGRVIYWYAYAKAKELMGQELDEAERKNIKRVEALNNTHRDTSYYYD